MNYYIKNIMACPICLSEDNSLCSKFLCPHTTCKDCFRMQISSPYPLNLCCSICRANINYDLFDDDEKNLYRQRELRMNREEEERRQDTSPAFRLCASETPPVEPGARPQAQGMEHRLELLVRRCHSSVAGWWGSCSACPMHQRVHIFFSREHRQGKKRKATGG